MRAAAIWVMLTAVAAFPGALPVASAIKLLALTPALEAKLAKNALAATRINVPVRVKNWGGGSCVHASTVHLLHWQGQHELAQHWRATYSGGEWPEHMDKTLDAEGINYAQTTKGDVKFLEWAIATRRGANVTVNNAAHMVTLVGLDNTTATILDSNDPQKTRKQPREQFLADWRSGSSGGWAFTTLFDPLPPKPWAIVSK